MAYILKIHNEDIRSRIGWLLTELEAAAKEAGFFVQPKEHVSYNPYSKGPKTGSRKLAKAVIDMGKVRLFDKKEYCGNHPGPCFVGPFGARPKMKARYLEWDDWVRFHAIVNDVLDDQKIDADVSTRPQDARGVMWIRKGTKRRYVYSYEDDWSRGNLQGPLRIWNLGTDSEFSPPFDTSDTNEAWGMTGQ